MDGVVSGLPVIDEMRGRMVAVLEVEQNMEAIDSSPVVSCEREESYRP